MCVLPSSPAYLYLILPDLPVLNLPACFFGLWPSSLPIVGFVCLYWLISWFSLLPERISKPNFPCNFDYLIVVLLGSMLLVPVRVTVQSGQHEPSRLWLTPKATRGTGQRSSALWWTTYLYSQGGLQEMVTRHERSMGSIQELYQRFSLSEHGLGPICHSTSATSSSIRSSVASFWTGLWHS